jgi:hypothetical protein
MSFFILMCKDELQTVRCCSRVVSFGLVVPSRAMCTNGRSLVACKRWLWSSDLPSFYMDRALALGRAQETYIYLPKNILT